jgi:hypothetical protein
MRLNFLYSIVKGSDSDLDPHSLWIGISIQLESSAADPTPESGSFCPPGYGIRDEKKIRIRDPR